MKTALFVLAVLVVLVIPLPGGRALAPGLNLSLTSQQPFPAEPGQNVELELELRNTGLGEAKNLQLSWVAASPFTLLPGQGPATIGLLPAQSAVKKIFRFRVDATTVSGSYPLEWRIDLGGGTTLVEKTTVSVRGTPRVVLERAALYPDSPDAGGTAELTIFLRNAGTGTARRLSLSFNASPALAPLLASGAPYLGDLLPGQVTSVTIQLGIDRAAEQKVYTGVLTAVFERDDGTVHTVLFDLGLPVQGTVLLDVLKVTADPVRQVLEVELANKGSAEAKAVEVRLHAGGLTETDYVSQIKPDKKTTFSFPLPAHGNLTLELRYRGPGLEERTEIRQLSVSTPRLPAGDSSGIWVVVVVVLLAAVLLWRRRRKKAHAADV